MLWFAWLINMNGFEKLNNIKQYAVTFGKWCFFGGLLGSLGGLIGAGFFHALSWVTALRESYSLLLFFLPLAGILTVLLYRLCRLQENRGTNEMIDGANHNAPVKGIVAPVIFVATLLTHLCGGSAGREGAALQMGGAGASVVAKAFRLNDQAKKIFLLAGMSAVFAGVFGTPLAAMVFTLEFLAVGSVFSVALFPCGVAAITASTLSHTLGVHVETAPLTQSLSLSPQLIGKVVFLAAAIGILGTFQCFVFHKSEHLFKRYLPSPLLRIIVGSVVIIALTLMLGNGRYNGAGMDVAIHAMEGQFYWYDFLLKLVFTAVTLAAGFKGGEIVPTFFIGATFGCFMGSVLGISPALAGALGLVALFCCVTNTPIASLLLSVELFGGNHLLLFAIVCLIAFLLSGKQGLYKSQTFLFSKATLEESLADSTVKE